MKRRCVQMLELAKEFSKQKTPIELSVNAIIKDIEDRRGLKHIWAEIDATTKREIKKLWCHIISDALKYY